MSVKPRLRVALRRGREGAGRIRRLPRRLRHRGRAVVCPVCGGSFGSFVPHGPARPAAVCPGCGALERHRGLALWLAEATDVLDGPRSLLHVAPEPPLQRRLARAPELDYVSVDLDSPYADVHADVAALPFPAGRFDAVVCSHVLEHVHDDRSGLRELGRVLKPGGWAVVLVPVDPARAATDEDPGETDPAERRRRFGQEDHVRAYGRDFPRRVREAGLLVEEDSWILDRAPATARRHGLGHDPLYVCRPGALKPSRT